MLIQNCFKGQRVVYKESGRCATVLSVSHNVGKITIAFENAERKDVSPAALEPATEEASHKTESGIAMRPCPNCATKMPASESTCPNCGFEYGVKRSNAPGSFFKAFVTIVVLAAVAYAVWKYILHR